MTTVTGLTAARMLEIEAESVVDGDVIGDNLILTKHDGTQINAGNVRGPVGPQGPMGAPTSVLAAVPILDVGMSNQIRAGRQLTAADFTAMGLSAPIGLWNLSDLTDASGNARTLNNKGAISFSPGINGVANTAAQFVGNPAQALYIPDTGANDPFRIKTGSIGCWFKTAKQGVAQTLFSKDSNSSRGFGLALVYNTGTIQVFTSSDGSATAINSGVSVVWDDRWHFCVVTFDGSLIRIYIDSFLETIVPNGLIFGSSGPLNVGGQWADGSTASTQPHFGRIDEAFITNDVLSEDEIRNLYCAKIPHTLSTLPVRVSINVRRRRKGAALAAVDFPTQPLRLHNFSAASLGDEGSNGVALTNNGAAVGVTGADGSSGNAFNFIGSAAQSLSSVDTGLPLGTNARSYGCWFKSTSAAGIGMLAWGTVTTADARLILTNGNISSASAGDQIIGPICNDGAWHFAVVVEDNAAADGCKRKLYTDGKLVGISTVLNGITLAGANRFRVGANPDGSFPFTGQIDAAFVCGYALTGDQISALYAKGVQTLAPSPKNAGDHVEVINVNNLLCAFDTLESQHQIDMVVT